MMILICELAWGNSFSPILENKITTKNLKFRARIPSSGPLFSTGAMGRISVTLKYRLDRQLHYLSFECGAILHCSSAVGSPCVILCVGGYICLF